MTAFLLTLCRKTKIDSLIRYQQVNYRASHSKRCACHVGIHCRQLIKHLTRLMCADELFLHFAPLEKA